MFDYWRKRRAPRVALPDASAPRDFFTRIYDKNLWTGKESLSGIGSEGEAAAQKIDIFQTLLNEFGITSLLDLGCGDFYWMQEIAPGLQRYHGVDVVKHVVRRNQLRYGSRKITFQCIDLSNPRDQQRLKPRDFDLVTTLDVFGHLLNEEVDSLLRFILDDLDVTYWLVTNRRDGESADYLTRPKSRHEGIDLEAHPRMQERGLRRVWQTPAAFPGDYFDLYELRG
jgi:predicted TPR repeat methyltransferase